MTRREADRALAAVHRVREVRERDSRLGLAHALAECRRRDQAVEEADRRLAEAAPFRAGTVGDYLTQVTQGARLAAAVAEAGRRAEAAQTLAAEAGDHWRRDRAATRVVELLLERHAEARRAELARAEARALDDIAGQAWLRGHPSGPGAAR